MISDYIAAPFPEGENARKLRAALAAHGIGCTSRWLEEETALGDTPTLEKKIQFSRMDRYDVRRSQAVVLWNPESYAKSGTGGRHVETGMAFMLAEMPVFVVGAQTNIFAWLPEAEQVFTDIPFDAMVDHLASRIKGKCFDFGPTWDQEGLSL